MFRGLIWRAPRTDDEALALLRCVGAMDCRGLVDPTLMIWLTCQDVSTVLDWFTAYSYARAGGKPCGDHELAHAFGFLTVVHPQLIPVMARMFP